MLTRSRLADPSRYLRQSSSSKTASVWNLLAISWAKLFVTLSDPESAQLCVFLGLPGFGLPAHSNEQRKLPSKRRASSHISRLFVHQSLLQSFERTTYRVVGRVLSEMIRMSENDEDG